MILVRHGQSYFNLHFNATRVDPGIPDPRLTETGRQQALAAVAPLGARRLKRLIASPYMRALETAAIIAEALALPIAIEPLVRERAAFSCDIGTPASELKRLWPSLSFGHLAERWWGDREESEAEIVARAHAFRQTMAAAADWTEVAVITHWGFIRALTGETVTNGAHLPFDPTAPAAEQD